jgi:hypothetical protein
MEIALVHSNHTPSLTANQIHSGPINAKFGAIITLYRRKFLPSESRLLELKKKLHKVFPADSALVDAFTVAREDEIDEIDLMLKAPATPANVNLLAQRLSIADIPELEFSTREHHAHLLVCRLEMTKHLAARELSYRAEGADRPWTVPHLIAISVPKSDDISHLGDVKLRATRKNRPRVPDSTLHPGEHFHAQSPLCHGCLWYWLSPLGRARSLERCSTNGKSA